MAFGSDDPGVLTVSNRMFTFPDEALEATFNQTKKVIDKLRKGLPTTPAVGNEECLRRCGKKY